MGDFILEWLLKIAIATGLLVAILAAASPVIWLVAMLRAVAFRPFWESIRDGYGVALRVWVVMSEVIN